MYVLTLGVRNCITLSILTFSASCALEPRNEVHGNARSQVNLICQDIQAMYDAGTPVFTKDSIRKIGEELKHFQNGEHNNDAKITLKGINGVDYEL